MSLFSAQLSTRTRLLNVFPRQMHEHLKDKSQGLFIVLYLSVLSICQSIHLSLKLLHISVYLDY